ncbi:MAG TPA: ABC transporter substrate-binding protein [Solirubrobacteraceae bacterium]|jgi:multiple sugar transport system substrate-binding protein|nr:ABC transporter substrate-binding protein [Solirubrobacteraceae bacterium]
MKRTGLIILAMLGIAAVFAAAGCGGSSSNGTSSGSATGGHVDITFWHGYTEAEAKAIKQLVAQFNSEHKNITVTAQYSGNSDYALQKVLAAIAGGKPPDISYLYGSWAPNIATSPGVVTLNDLIKEDPSFDWNDFYPSERAVATVDGKIVGVPALVDNLALVYNKKLFAAAGIPAPTANWTWSDFEQAAIKLTNPAKKQFGWAYVNDGSEDTVWRFWAMLWQAGGAILSSDGKQAAFDSPAGIKAMTLLQKLEQHKAIYFDNGNQAYLPLFTSGHIGMLWTGPWDLANISSTNVSYGVQILPAEQNHQTISGPDNWVVFDNGSARTKASWEFLKWLTSPQIDLKWATMTGDLPVRQSVTKLPGYKAFTAKYPGVSTWVQNLSNATQARPVTTLYPKISTVVGQAVQSVLLGKASPQQALSQAAQEVNGILSVPG